jgi:hypothetical protein
MSHRATEACSPWPTMSCPDRVVAQSDGAPGFRDVACGAPEVVGSNPADLPVI